MLSDFAAEIYFDSLGCITFEVFVKAKVASGTGDPVFRYHVKSNYLGRPLFELSPLTPLALGHYFSRLRHNV
ncbi:hypothetical protein LENED_002447 [Lentinula edodes]|uniref:Uncharacterized protein n=1 Tax=Lentinula edodes TaxID=5353 RepID=A0A1Q3E159_LENED|nr:hypothetical protein LENED_002447 [Lentinula edodes]